ncbi:uncharacterized protein MELLADRAFT_123230 [Melampsora larici-populina 98AG31]|uniref:Secreted protein n=1 Tax=Melampsora larici-populina (strain 98AG31 / pathotype 3-4-7) TaxID=747676 RepID=F4SDZ1_MELLP|nr:uncharacterized protein MELLADRAFT_123230 [Melampsora larici-populina 98AG31]EGF97135.1 secreted protein [Melampsora larici-populina 98AG31]
MDAYQIMIGRPSSNSCALRTLLVLAWLLIAVSASEVDFLWRTEAMLFDNEVKLSWEGGNPEFQYVGGSGLLRGKIEALDWVKNKWEALVVASKRAHSASLHELNLKDNHLNIDDSTGVTFVKLRGTKLIQSQSPQLLSHL